MTKLAKTEENKKKQSRTNRHKAQKVHPVIFRQITVNVTKSDL
jgi:hypothetical protein